MSRYRNITYAINKENGHIVSRVDGEVALLILDWDGMKPENNFTTLNPRNVKYNLEKFNVSDLVGEWHLLVWTNKIDVRWKNIHRKFWGMKPLKADKPEKCHRCGELHRWDEMPCSINTCGICFEYVCMKCGELRDGWMVCKHHRKARDE